MTVTCSHLLQWTDIITQTLIYHELHRMILYFECYQFTGESMFTYKDSWGLLLLCVRTTH